MKPTFEERLEAVEQALLDRIPPPARSLETIKEIEVEGYRIAKRCMEVVCDESDLPIKSMRWRGRTKHLAQWRQVAMYLAFEVSGLSSQDVATIFNRKDHATILYAHRMVPRRYSAEVLKKLRRQIVSKQNAA